MKKRELIFMPDYHCFPIWEPEAASTNVNPASLPISAVLQKALSAWSERYDATLAIEDPRLSGFLSPNDEASFRDDGTILFERLREELGTEYNVTLRLVTGVKALI